MSVSTTFSKGAIALIISAVAIVLGVLIMDSIGQELCFTITPAIGSIANVEFADAETITYTDIIAINTTHFLAAYVNATSKGEANVLYINSTDGVSVGPVGNTENKATFYSQPRLAQHNSTHYLQLYRDTNGNKFYVGGIYMNPADMSIQNVSTLYVGEANDRVNIVAINTTHFVAAYTGPLSDGYAKVLELDPANFIVTPYENNTFDATTGRCRGDILRFNDTDYIIAYNGNAGDGYAMILEVNASLGVESNTALEFAFNDADGMDIDSLDSTHYLVAFTEGASDFLYAMVLEADFSTNVITNYTRATINASSIEYESLSVTALSSESAIITFNDTYNQGRATYVEIDTTTWEITVSDTDVFDSTQGRFNSLVRLNATAALNVYRGTDNDGYVTLLDTVFSSGPCSGDAYNSTVSIIDAWGSFASWLTIIIITFAGIITILYFKYTGYL